MNSRSLVNDEQSSTNQLNQPASAQVNKQLSDKGMKFVETKADGTKAGHGELELAPPTMAHAGAAAQRTSPPVLPGLHWSAGGRRPNLSHQPFYRGFFDVSLGLYWITALAMIVGGISGVVGIDLRSFSWQ